MKPYEVMSSKLLIYFTLNMLRHHEVDALPKNDSGVMAISVPRGETVTLLCRSNDKNHNFFYWSWKDRNSDKYTVVGPSNNYDISKYNYEVLSGNLTIKAVSKAEEGVYNCVSRGVTRDDINIRSVRMTVEGDWEEVYEHDPNVHLFRAVIVIATLLIITGVGYAGYRIWKKRYVQPSYLVPSEEDEEDSGDELFRVPGVPQDSETQMVKNASTDSFEAPGISTDFNRLLDTVNNK